MSGCPSTALALRDEAVALQVLREAVGDIENLMYEAWAFDSTLTKDAARRFCAIAEVLSFDGNLEWVGEMRDWCGK